MSAELRPYQTSDFDAVKALHEASEIDYRFPDLSSPLFLITKVLIVDGILRACGGVYLQVECYLWIDKSDWLPPEDRFDCIRLLDKAIMDEVWKLGIDQAVFWLPPGMARFGDRVRKELGFTQDRDGWVSYSKATKQ